MTLRVSSADFCGQVVANVDLAGVMDSYSDPEHSIPQNSWSHMLRVPAYFRAILSSPIMSIFICDLVQVSVSTITLGQWGSTVDLFIAGSVTSEGLDAGFATAPAPFNEVYFSFEVWKFFIYGIPNETSVYVTATISVGFSSSHSLRKRSYELSNGDDAEDEPATTGRAKRSMEARKTLSLSVTLQPNPYVDISSVLTTKASEESHLEKKIDGDGDGDEEAEVMPEDSAPTDGAADSKEPTDRHTVLVGKIASLLCIVALIAYLLQSLWKGIT